MAIIKMRNLDQPETARYKLPLQRAWPANALPSSAI